MESSSEVSLPSRSYKLRKSKCAFTLKILAKRYNRNKFLTYTSKPSNQFITAIERGGREPVITVLPKLTNEFIKTILGTILF